MIVIKRNGTKEEFQFNKISSVIEKAFKEVNRSFDGEVLEKLKLYVDNEIDQEQEEIEVDDIHNIVEQFLMKYDYFDVGKAYIVSRYNKAIGRATNKKLIEEISKKLGATNVQNQNANVDERSFGGRMGEITRYVLKDYALNYCMSKTSRRNHLNNEIYIHDLDSYAIGSHNCLSIPFDDLLKNGFNTRQVDIRPANSVNTAFQLLAVVFQLQSLQQFGGVSATHLDWTMVPYVRKSFYKHYKIGLEFLLDFSEEQINGFGINDTLSIENEKYKSEEKAYNYALKLTTKELVQAVEGMYHNLNSLQSRSGKMIAALIN